MCVITRPTYEYEYVCVLLYNASRLVRLPTPYTPPLALARITRLIYGTNVVSTRWIRVLPSGTSTTLELLFEILHATEANHQSCDALLASRQATGSTPPASLREAQGASRSSGGGGTS
jgi:hypothetical protein